LDDDDDDKNANGGRVDVAFSLEEEKSDSESDDAPPEEVSRAVAEKEVEEERVQKKRAVDAKQMEKATAAGLTLQQQFAKLEAANPFVREVEPLKSKDKPVKVKLASDLTGLLDQLGLSKSIRSKVVAELKGVGASAAFKDQCNFQPICVVLPAGSPLTGSAKITAVESTFCPADSGKTLLESDVAGMPLWVLIAAGVGATALCLVIIIVVAAAAGKKKDPIDMNDVEDAGL